MACSDYALTWLCSVPLYGLCLYALVGIAIISDHGVKWGVFGAALQGVFGRSLWRVGWGGIVLLGC